MMLLHLWRIREGQRARDDVLVVPDTILVRGFAPPVQPSGECNAEEDRDAQTDADGDY